MTFDLSKIKCKNLRKVNELLLGYDLIELITLLGKIEQVKYNPAQARTEEWFTPADEIFVNKDFLPYFFTMYCTQQAIYLQNVNKELKKSNTKPKLEFFQTLDFLHKNLDDPILRNDVLSKKRKIAAASRRTKNQQFPYYYFFMQGNVRLFRLAKIISIGKKRNDYNFDESFKDLTNGMDYATFCLCIATIFYFLTNDLRKNAVTKDLLINTEDIKEFPEEQIDKFFEIISFSSFEDCVKAYDAQFKDYVKKLTDHYQDGEQIYYSLHKYIPSIFRFKPLIKINKDYFCPSPYMLDIFFNDFLFELTRIDDRNKGKGDFLTWFGKAFESYCTEILGGSTKEYSIVTENDIYKNFINEDRPGTADICLKLGNRAILFDFKTATPKVLALITGRESKNKNEWSDMQKKMNDDLLQIYSAIDTIKNNTVIMETHASLKGITEFYPIIVFYSSIFDLNTLFEDKINDCVTKLSIKDLRWINTLGFKQHKVLFLSVYEYELLIELLHKDIDAFISCVEELFSNERFSFTSRSTSNLRNALTDEPSQIIFGHRSRAGLKNESNDIWHHRQGELLKSWFETEIMKKTIDSLVLKDQIETKEKEVQNVGNT